MYLCKRNESVGNMAETDNIIIKDSLDGLGTDAYGNYLAHALCLAGSCKLKYNGEERQLQAGNLMIVRKGKLVERIRPAEDFRVKVIYVASEFIELSTPLSNYGMKGQLALFLDPVMKLDAGQLELCRKDFEMVEERLAQTDHHFRRDLLIASVQLLIIDFFDFHSHLYGVDNIPLQSAAIMSRFLNMLENGTYREHREVKWFADKLCVTPKYLSEVCRKVSGYPANYWINRYTVLDISRLLRDKSLTFVRISDMFGFSSPAYFSRYVQQHLGVSPTEYRG
jgi:AraC family transcriptional activator of pobA